MDILNDASNVKNARMYSLAKDDGEVAFINTISNSIYKPIDICQAFGDDDWKRHYDIKMLEYDNVLKANAWHYVDVKDVEEKNFSTGNYVLRQPFFEFHQEIKPYGYYVAFRLIENNARTSKFVLVNIQEMLARCKLSNRLGYSLVSLEDVCKCCNFRKIEEELI